jgi:hypothetical protein
MFPAEEYSYFKFGINITLKNLRIDYSMDLLNIGITI